MDVKSPENEQMSSHYPFLKYAKWSNFPILIMLLGMLIRLLGYTSSSIRYDEAVSLYRATTPFIQYLSDLQRYSSLFLWEFILRLISIFGHEIWLIRLPAVLIGVSTLSIVLKLMHEFGFSTIQRSFIASMIAFCPGLLWVSQDARAYGLLIFLYLLAILFILERKWLGFVAICGLLIYTHIIGPAFAVGGFVFAFITYPKEWKKFILMGLAVVTTWIPWVLLYINIQSTPQFINTFWLGKFTFGPFILQMIYAYFTRLVSYPIIIVFLVTIVLSIIIAVKSSKRQTIKYSLIFLAPFLIIFFESIFWENTLFYRTLITLIIPFALSLGSIITLDRKNLLAWVVAGLWMVTAVIGVIGWNPRLRGGDVDKAARMIKANWQEGDVIYYGTGTAALPFDYYLDDRPEYMLDGISNSNLTPPSLRRKFDFTPLENIEKDRAWVIFPLDTFIPKEQMNRLMDYVKEGELISTVKVFEVPDIQVYLVNSKAE